MKLLFFCVIKPRSAARLVLLLYIRLLELRWASVGERRTREESDAKTSPAKTHDVDWKNVLIFSSFTLLVLVLSLHDGVIFLCYVYQSYTDVITSALAFERQINIPTRSILVYRSSKHATMSIFPFGKNLCPACSHMKRLFSSESSSTRPSRSVLLTSPIYNPSPQSTTAPQTWIPMKQRRKSMAALDLKPKEKEGNNPWSK